MSDYIKITEQPSNYNALETMSSKDLLLGINNEDQKIAEAVKYIIPSITKLVDSIVECYKKGGRLFYIGAGTSGRLGILDASEIPPTFGVIDRVIGIIAGGDKAIRNAVENAEDNLQQAWRDLEEFNITNNDVVVGIAASGTTPYVIGGVTMANEKGLLTACITNNPGSPLAKSVAIPLEINVGPEFVTGSTRMKSGTSQKMVLNMISTALMIKAGRVEGNKMVNMQLSNIKLVDRGTRYLVQELQINYNEAKAILEKYGSVKKAIEAFKKNV